MYNNNNIVESNKPWKMFIIHFIIEKLVFIRVKENRLVDAECGKTIFFL